MQVDFTMGSAGACFKKILRASKSMAFHVSDMYTGKERKENYHLHVQHLRGGGHPVSSLAKRGRVLPMLHRSKWLWNIET